MLTKLDQHLLFSYHNTPTPTPAVISIKFFLVKPKLLNNITEKLWTRKNICINLVLIYHQATCDIIHCRQYCQRYCSDIRKKVISKKKNAYNESITNGMPAKLTQVKHGMHAGRLRPAIFLVTSSVCSRSYIETGRR